MKTALNIAAAYPELPFAIEADVRQTRDCQLVLMHDADIARTMAGSGLLETMTLAQLLRTPMRSVRAINPEAQPASPEARAGLFPIFRADLRPATLPEVYALMETANRERCGQGGVPAGLALELKPEPVRVWPPVTSLMQAMRTGVSALASAVGFGDVAAGLFPANRTVASMVAFLNTRAETQAARPEVPTRLFGLGGSGKRDLGALWQQLSLEARQEIYPTTSLATLPYAQGLYREHTVAAPQAGPLGALASDVVDALSPFWTMGDPVKTRAGCPQAQAAAFPAGQAPEPHDRTTTLTPANTPEAMEAALAKRLGLITTELPELLLPMIADRLPARVSGLVAQGEPARSCAPSSALATTTPASRVGAVAGLSPLQLSAPGMCRA